ncbi:MAG: hypothetical protein R3292_13410, partial [Alcanivorax sp.]|nr:hypothetical protein [Alcanivorax sp.]
YQPLPAGIMVSRLTSPVRPADGVSVNLAPGTVPALLVENRSNRPLVVRRDDGQPYLRIDRRGSFLNAGEGQQTRWVQVSDVPRYTWTEPRATLAATQVPVALRESGHEAVVSHWRLPVRLGGESLAVAGEVIWHPQKGKDSHHH